MSTIAHNATLAICCFLAATLHSQSFASDDRPVSEKLSSDSLQTLINRLESNKAPLTPEEREEILLYALNPELKPEHAGALLFVHIVSSSRIDTAGAEVVVHADKLETRIRSTSDIDLWGRLVGSLAFAFEDEKLGDALEEKWFRQIEKESPARQAAFFAAMAAPGWLSSKKRLIRLADAYNNEDISQECRELIVDVVWAGLSNSQLKAWEACLFYRDLATSKFASPALTAHMFERLADLASTAEFANRKNEEPE